MLVAKFGDESSQHFRILLVFAKHLIITRPALFILTNIYLFFSRLSLQIEPVVPKLREPKEKSRHRREVFSGKACEKN